MTLEQAARAGVHGVRRPDWHAYECAPLYETWSTDGRWLPVATIPTARVAAMQSDMGGDDEWIPCACKEANCDREA